MCIRDRTIGKFSGQERPTQEQLHGRSGLSTRIWLWLVRLFYQCQLYIKTAYTWFWLGWPNAGLPQELFLHFFAQETLTQEQLHRRSAFLPQYDSGLCVCCTSDSHVQENAIHDSGLCGQMQVFCMNYWYIFWPGKANTRTAMWTFSPLFTSIWFWLVRLFYQWQQYITTCLLYTSPSPRD